jgi:hypothetical protein
MHHALLTTGKALLEPAVLAAGHQVTFVAPTDRLEELRAQYPGHHVLGIDNWDSEKSLTALDRELPYDIEVVATVDEQAIAAAGWLRTQRGLPGLTHSQALAYTDKKVMLDTFSSAGLPVAPYRVVRRTTVDGTVVEADEQIETAAAEVGGFPVVVKPTRGQAAVNTIRIRDTAHLRELRDQGTFRTAQADASGRFGASSRLNALNDQEDGFLVQRYIDMTGRAAREYWCDVYMHHGTVLLTPVGWYDTPPMDAGGRHRHWTSLSPDDPEVTDVIVLATTAVNALGGTTGVSHVEVLRDSDGQLWLGEAAYRVGGQKWQMYGLHYGMDVPTVLAQLAAGQRPPIDHLTPRYPLLATLSLAPSAGTVRRMAPEEAILQLPGVIEADLHLKVGEPVPDPIGVVPMGGRIVWAPEGTDETTISRDIHRLLDGLDLKVESAAS